MSSLNKKNGLSDNKQEVVSITYEEIGLFPRSFSRVLDRFLKQVFSDVENLVIQEYRFYRYLFLTTLKCLFILFFVPFFVNFLAKTYVVRPLTEYFWNTKQPEIFLNSYQQKHAFAELKDFEEKLYFESLIYPKTAFIHEGHKEEPSALGMTESTIVPPAPSVTGGQKVLYSEMHGYPFQNEAPPAARAAEGGKAGGAEPKVSLREGAASQSKALALGCEAYPSTDILLLSKPPLAVWKAEGGPKEDRQQSCLGKETASLPSQSFGGEESGMLSQGKSRESVYVTKGEATYEKTESLINAYTLKSSLFVYQTIEADKNIQQRYQEKTIELAQRYNDQSIEEITNFFADLISLFTLFYLLYALEIQINITKSFLLEVFFGLDDSKKSLLILLVTDLLVGYHSSNLWELFFEFIFHHYGLPESQTGIFLLVATLPVLLDVLFKYLIFRHLNRSSPATVATYHAMIE